VQYTVSAYRRCTQDRGCTHDTDQTSLERHILGCPGKVSAVEAECAVFGVPTAGADGMDTLGTDNKLGVGGLTAELEFSLFAVMWALGTGG
jgi:hypothetical protein